MPLIPWAVGLTASRPSENGTSMTSPLHSDPSWHSVFPQSPKKIQENLKQTGSPGRRQPDIAFGGCRQGFLCASFVR